MYEFVRILRNTSAVKLFGVMSQAPAHAGYAVLVVEDEPLIRLEALDIVSDAGFVAYEAANADDALVLLERHADIRVLLTDIEMPGSMDGLKLAHAVRERWPPIVVLVVSGRSGVSERELPADSIFFAKPYSPKVLADTLQDVASRISA